MAKRRTRGRGRSSIGRLVRRVALAVVVLGLLVVGAVGLVAYREITRSLPALDAVVEYQPPVASQVFAADGTMIGEFFSEKRYLVPMERIPPVVRHAFIAAEDDGFYRHSGIDVVSMVRAFLNNVGAGRTVQGASTITQQVVKSLLLTPTRSYERKIKEIILALRLERTLTKDQILALYLNHIYLGSGAHGVAAAAREYFGKDVEQLNLAEAALLAGLPQAPSRYSPFQHWPQAKARQRYVLGRMYESHFINREERDAALRQPLALATRRGGLHAAPYFVEHVRRDLEERLGYNALYEMGLRVYTTIDLQMEGYAETALRQGLETLAARQHGYRNSFRNLDPDARELYLRQQQAMLEGDTLEPGRVYDAVVTSHRGTSARVQVGPFTGELVADGESAALPALDPNDLIRVQVLENNGGGLKFVLDSSPAIEGGLVAIEPRTGYVRALVGGYDFDRSTFNRVTQAKRQPGSAFKPLVYAAALDRHFTMSSVVIDEPIYFQQVGGKIWSPQNFEKEYFGPTSLHTALVKSRNVVTVKVANSIGVRYLVKYLQRFGLPKLPPNLSIALGSAELTPLELAVAYTPFANKGLRPKPIFVTSITDQSGRVLERNEPELNEAIPADTAYVITNVLEDAVRRGTGKRASGLGRPTAGKTGTTNDQHDAWFVGYTPQLLATVWLGFDAKRSIGKKETGGRAAAPIWKAFMEQALEEVPVENFEKPEDVRCVGSLDGGRECFKRGTFASAPEPETGGEEQIQIIPSDTQPQPVAGEGRGEPKALDFLREDF